MSIHHLYGGEVILEFDEAKHVYTVTDGGWTRIVPGVTGILSVINKPALPRWAAKETAEYVARTLKPGVSLDEVQIAQLAKDAKAAPWRKAEEAADIGTIVHKYAEDYALEKRPEMPVNPLARAATEQFLEWWHSNHVEVAAVEKRVYSRSRRYAGTVDLLAWVNDARAVIDHKTSTGIWPEYALQLAAYDMANFEDGASTADTWWCLRFGKDGAFEAHEYPPDTHDQHRDGFDAALALYRWQQSVNPPKRKAA